MPQPLVTLSQHPDAPMMEVSPANGFVPETYLPMLAPLTDTYHIVSVPPRPLWGDQPAPDLPSDYSWHDIADDMITAYDQYDLRDVVAIGHSIGGVTAFLAALQQPQYFKALILLDPVILPPVAVNWMRDMRDKDQIPNENMVTGALRRRTTFESVDAAFENFHGKSIFADWPDEVLRLYVEHGTIPCDDGMRCLKWAPKWEAFYFGTYYTGIWDSLAELADVSLPILFVRGGTSDTFMADAADKAQAIVPDATFKTVAGHGHLFPQSAPKITGDLIAEWLIQVLD